MTAHTSKATASSVPGVHQAAPLLIVVYSLWLFLVIFGEDDLLRAMPSASGSPGASAPEHCGLTVRVAAFMQSEAVQTLSDAALLAGGIAVLGGAWITGRGLTALCAYLAVATAYITIDLASCVVFRAYVMRHSGILLYEQLATHGAATLSIPTASLGGLLVRWLPHVLLATVCAIAFVAARRSPRGPRRG